MRLSLSKHAMPTKRIFLIGDFKDEKPQSVFMEERKLFKGLTRFGHDVEHFSYRNVMMQSTSFAKRWWARSRAKEKADDILIKKVQYYYPDIILASSPKFLNPSLIDRVRQAAPDAMLIARDVDPYPDHYPEKIEVGSLVDLVIMSSAGQFLQAYKDGGAKRCAFLPMSVDPDIQHRYANPPADLVSDITFTGTVKHGGLPREDERYEILHRLLDYPGAKLHGCFGQPRTQGLHCFMAFSAAKIALSINIANNVRLYHSDRFVNTPACGPLMLAKRAPGYELLFEDGVHCRYFDTTEEFFELADWYLSHEDERMRIADAGMQHAHEQFNCTKIAGHLIDLAIHGKYDAPWAETL